MESELPSNRDKKRAPKKGKYWCPVCDCALVWDGRKCPNCGSKIKPKRNKR